MEKHIPEPDQARLISLYRSLVDIARRQAECLSHEISENAIVAFNRLADEWTEAVDHIEIFRKNERSTGSGNTVIRDELIRLSEYQITIEKALQEYYNELTTNMRAVKHHKTVLHAYGNVGLKNDFPFYFDKKN